MASDPENGAPVRAAYSPSAPGARDSRNAPPTSGMNPMPTSGIATFEVSVTTRTLPGALAVDQVLVTPEFPCFDAVLAGALVDRDDIAAGAQPAFAGPGQHHHAH